MAKKSKIARNEYRERQVAKYREVRAELKKKMLDFSLSEEERTAAARKLASLPRDSSATRVRMRCEVTGRPRGNYRRFKLSRIKFRELSLEGKIPGITKSSW